MDFWSGTNLLPKSRNSEHFGWYIKNFLKDAEIFFGHLVCHWSVKIKDVILDSTLNVFILKVKGTNI